MEEQNLSVPDVVSNAKNNWGVRKSYSSSVESDYCDPELFSAVLAAFRYLSKNHFQEKSHPGYYGKTYHFNDDQSVLTLEFHPWTKYDTVKQHTDGLQNYIACLALSRQEAPGDGPNFGGTMDLSSLVDTQGHANLVKISDEGKYLKAEIYIFKVAQVIRFN